MTLAVFKTCPNCRHVWRTREHFLSDPELIPIGYQVNFGELKTGFFLFLHQVHECGTSLAVQVLKFTDMYDGPVFEERLTGTDNCPKYCLHDDALERCFNKCECAFVREVLHKIKEWPKTR